MRAAAWSRQMATSKGIYTMVLFFVFAILNLLVHFTYEWSGKISLSYLSLRLVFEGYFTRLTGQPIVGVLMFCVFTIILVRGILAMFGTRMQIIGWLLLLVLLVSALPIFSYRSIFI
jgi:hypothetical protein